MFIAIPTTARTDHALARARRCVARDCRHLIQVAASPRHSTHDSLEVSDFFAGQNDTAEFVSTIEAAMSRPIQGK